MATEWYEKTAAEMIAAVKSYVQRATAPLATRVATLEARTSALAMMLIGRTAEERKTLAELEAMLVSRTGDAAPAEAIRGLVQRADKTSTSVESLERRASRHAEHLARLEDRVRRLEAK